MKVSGEVCASISARWVWVGLYGLFLFFSAVYIYPFARAAQAKGYGHLGIVFSHAITGLVGVVVIAQAIRSIARRRVVNLLVMVLIAAGFMTAFHSIHQPIEQFHFLQYGLLGVLVFWALPGRTYTLQFYCAALTVFLVVGYIDEIIQGLVPDRIYDLQDTGIDVLSAGLGLLLCRLMDLSAPAPLHPAGRSKHAALAATERPPLVDIHIFGKDLLFLVPLAAILLANKILVTRVQEADLVGSWACNPPASCTLTLDPDKQAHLEMPACEFSAQYSLAGNALDGFRVQLYIDPEDEDPCPESGVHAHPVFEVHGSGRAVALAHKKLGTLGRIE